MKRALQKVAALAICSASLILSSTVSASGLELSKKGLYEMRTLAGNFQQGFADGASRTSNLFEPTSLLQLNDGSILISDSSNHRLRLLKNNKLLSYSGLIFDFDDRGFPVGAYNDGTNETAFYHFPSGITQDGHGNIYVADSENHSIRKITPQGEVTTLAGNGYPGDQDGIKQNARFFNPSDVAVDQDGNVYVADTLNHLIKKIDVNGKVTTLNMRSNRVAEIYPGIVENSGDFRDGPLSQALFNEPRGLAIDDKGNLYVSDTGNQRIRYIDFASGTVSTIAGGGQYDANSLYVAGDYVDGTVDKARFSSPIGLTVAHDDSILVADRSNHVIRVIKDGEVYTIAGQATEYGNDDGILSAAYLDEPTDVIELFDGSLAIADSGNNKIRIVQRYQAPEHQEDGNIHVIIDGKLLQSDVAPQLKNGRTYVPLRALADQLGYKVSYDTNRAQVSLVINNQQSFIFAENGANAMKIDGDNVQTLDETGIIYQNRLLVPIRFITEQLQYDVEWDSEYKHVVVRTPIFNE